MKRYFRSFISLFLVAIIIVSAVACNSDGGSINLMDRIDADENDGGTKAPDGSNTHQSDVDYAGHNIDLPNADNAKMTDFAVRLFANSHKSGENTLISPLSVISALAMTAGGADGNTLAQMEAVFDMDIDSLLSYLSAYVNNLPQGEKYKLSLANSIWLTNNDSFSVNEDFLQLNANYLSADIYEAPFDSTTVRDINNWVEEKTDGMIEKVIEDISQEAVMYLINALAFDAEWQNVFGKWDVRDGVFILEDGSFQDVKYMYSSENSYIESKNATGFIKHYSGGKYAFAALLPNEGITVDELIASLSGEELNALLLNADNISVLTSIPKFEVEYSVNMSDILKSMGIKDAFSPSDADFTKIGTSVKGNIFISKVIHKTYISVAEKGTQAGAVTTVVMAPTSAAPIIIPKTVYLDRPFVYMLIDCETGVPFFFGTMMEPGK